MFIPDMVELNAIIAQLQVNVQEFENMMDQAASLYSPFEKVDSPTLSLCNRMLNELYSDLEKFTTMKQILCN